MNERLRPALRFMLIGVAGYLSLATSAPEDRFVESAHVDVPLGAEASTARIHVTLDADAVIIVAPDALGIESSSGRVWTPDDGPLESEGYCEEYDRYGMFCEEVPGGSQAFDYEILLPPGAAGAMARIEVLAGGDESRVFSPGARFGLDIEVLP